MRPWTSRRRWKALAASVTLVVLTAAGWWFAGGEPIEAATEQTAGVEVPLHRGARTKPAVGAAIVVTVRWGRTDSSAPADPIDADTTPAVWDGYLALDCGEIGAIEPLSFELDDPKSSDLLAHADFLGPVVRGDGGDKRVYWRSKTQRDWDGLKARLVACDPDPNDPDSTGSTLTIRTVQRAYTARLDWSANDFVALGIERPGQALEVHINAQFDERQLAGARITRALSLPPLDPSAD